MRHISGGGTIHSHAPHLGKARPSTHHLPSDPHIHLSPSPTHSTQKNPPVHPLFSTPTVTTLAQAPLPLSTDSSPRSVQLLYPPPALNQNGLSFKKQIIWPSLVFCLEPYSACPAWFTRPCVEWLLTLSPALSCVTSPRTQCFTDIRYW